MMKNISYQYVCHKNCDFDFDVFDELCRQEIEVRKLPLTSKLSDLKDSKFAGEQYCTELFALINEHGNKDEKSFVMVGLLSPDNIYSAEALKAAWNIHRSLLIRCASHLEGLGFLGKIKHLMLNEPVGIYKFLLTCLFVGVGFFLYASSKESMTYTPWLPLLAFVVSFLVALYLYVWNGFQRWLNVFSERCGVRADQKGKLIVWIQLGFMVGAVYLLANWDETLFPVDYHKKKLNELISEDKAEDLFMDMRVHSFERLRVEVNKYNAGLATRFDVANARKSYELSNDMYNNQVLYRESEVATARNKLCSLGVREYCIK